MFGIGSGVSFLLTTRITLYLFNRRQRFQNRSPPGRNMPVCANWLSRCRDRGHHLARAGQLFAGAHSHAGSATEFCY